MPANPLQTTAFTVVPKGHDTGTGNCPPGPGFSVPPESPAAIAPKSNLFNATLDAEPSSSPYCTASAWYAGMPLVSSVCTEPACEGVS